MYSKEKNLMELEMLYTFKDTVAREFMLVPFSKDVLPANNYLISARKPFWMAFHPIRILV